MTQLRRSDISSSASKVGIAYSNSRRRSFDERDLRVKVADNWVHDQALLDRPGNAEIQMDLFYDYRTNLPLYPQVQAYFRKHQPPTLIVWGKNDKIFPAAGAYPYKRDLPKVEFHLIDTGHFALEDKADEMVPLIRDFLNRKIAS